MLLKSAARLAAEAKAREEVAKRWKFRNAHQKLPARELSAALRPRAGRPLSMGFYINWDDGESYAALKRELPRLDWVLPSWLSVSGSSLKITMDGKALRLVRGERPGVPILPVIQNASLGVWDGSGLAALLADPARRANLENGNRGIPPVGETAGCRRGLRNGAAWCVH